MWRDSIRFVFESRCNLVILFKMCQGVSRLMAWTILNRPSSTNNNGGTRSSSSPCLRLHITRHSNRSHTKLNCCSTRNSSDKGGGASASWLIVAYLWFVGSFCRPHMGEHPRAGRRTKTHQQRPVMHPKRLQSPSSRMVSRICSCTSWPPAGCQHQPVESSGGWRKSSHRIFACES